MDPALDKGVLPGDFRLPPVIVLCYPTFDCTLVARELLAHGHTEEGVSVLIPLQKTISS